MEKIEIILKSIRKIVGYFILDGILSIIFGILIFIYPNLLSMLVGLFFVLIGLTGIMMGIKINKYSKIEIKI